MSYFYHFKEKQLCLRSVTLQYTEGNENEYRNTEKHTFFFLYVRLNVCEFEGLVLITSLSRKSVFFIFCLLPSFFHSKQTSLL